MNLGQAERLDQALDEEPVPRSVGRLCSQLFYSQLFYSQPSRVPRSVGRLQLLLRARDPQLERGGGGAVVHTQVRGGAVSGGGTGWRRANLAVSASGVVLRVVILVASADGLERRRVRPRRRLCRCRPRQVAPLHRLRTNTGPSKPLSLCTAPQLDLCTACSLTAAVSAWRARLARPLARTLPPMLPPLALTLEEPNEPSARSPDSSVESSSVERRCGGAGTEPVEAREARREAREQRLSLARSAASEARAALARSSAWLTSSASASTSASASASASSVHVQGSGCVGLPA